MRPMYGDDDWKRPCEIPPSREGDEPYRHPIRRDSGRVLHSPAFRRLQGKTQLFPGSESDFFRNRLTHSLEVGQIAKSIAIRLNHITPEIKECGEISPDLCEIAGWCHDLGHPPFGHTGEEALDDAMLESGGFEGNGQTLRILGRLEKSPNRLEDADVGSEDRRVGLNLCYRTLASVLKYDRPVPAVRKKSGVVKGYYAEERELVNEIKRHVAGPDYTGPFKTVECSIMDIADDIAYSTYDLEDAFKGGFLSPWDLLAAPPTVMDSVMKEVSERFHDTWGETILEKDIHRALFETFREFFEGVPSPPVDDEEDLDLRRRLADATHAHRQLRELSLNGFTRRKFTSWLVGRFIRQVQLEFNEEWPALSRAVLQPYAWLQIETLKVFTFNSIIMSPAMRVTAFRGREMIADIHKIITKYEGGLALLPSDVRTLHDRLDSKYHNRVVCDFIASMTDRYAGEYYGRLTSEVPTTMFKPLG